MTNSLDALSEKIERMTKNSCSCSACRSACEHKPGWFLPNEAELAALHKGFTFLDFFKAYLAVDWWERDGGDIFLLSPALVGKKTGTEFPAAPHGRCVFFKDGLCEIYDMRPHECRAYMHGDENHVVKERHRLTAMAWDDPMRQAQIATLLGHEPVATDYNPFLLPWL